MNEYREIVVICEIDAELQRKLKLKKIKVFFLNNPITGIVIEWTSRLMCLPIYILSLYVADREQVNGTTQYQGRNIEHDVPISSRVIHEAIHPSH